MKMVAVLGLGYVGFPLVELLVKSKKYRVVGLDISAEKVRAAVKKLGPVRFLGTTDPEILREADITVACVPTPVKKNYQPDYGPLESACAMTAKNLKRGALVIIESTINPGTCEEIVVPLFKKLKLRAGKDYLLAHCPERIDPGNKVWTLENIPRNVGGFDAKSTRAAAAFYRSFLKGEVKVLNSLKAAEATKIVENTFRDINIAYVNELAMSFDRLGIDLLEVIEGAKTKPFAFMPHYPGAGVGGHCIAIDPYYLIERAKKSGFTHRFLKMARSVNNGMPAYTVGLLEKELAAKKRKLKGSHIGLLGLAYKKDIDDMRESPAVEIFHILKKKGAHVETFDPFLPKFSTVKNLPQLFKNNSAVVLATAHTPFLNISPAALKKAGVKIVIDGRNCLPKEKFLAAGITYKGIGH